MRLVNVSGAEHTHAVPLARSSGILRHSIHDTAAAFSSLHLRNRSERLYAGSIHSAALSEEKNKENLF